MVRGELVVNKDSGSSGDYVMQIYPTDPTGLPINAVLASATIANASVPDGISTITGTFDPPLGVVAGKGYALSLYRSASFPALRDWDTDPCPGTEAGSGSLSGPWEIDVGPNGPTFDLVFAVFVKPSNAFTLGRLERNKKKGTATLTANVPYPGELTASGNGVSAAVFSKTVGAPGDVHLLIKAKGKKKKNLNRKGKVKVNLAITYTPTGGDPSSQSIKVKLKKKLKKL